MMIRRATWPPTARALGTGSRSKRQSTAGSRNARTSQFDGPRHLLCRVPVSVWSQIRTLSQMWVVGMVDGRAVEADSRDSDAASTRAKPMVAVYRHDVHKLRARPHASAADSYAGVPVNESVPLNADQDAALLSRPAGEPEQTVANHESPYRLSLVTGETATTTERITASAGGGFRDLVTPDDPERLHARWLTSEVPAAFNESVYYPYTSLQYHTLLTAALLHNYRARVRGPLARGDDARRDAECRHGLNP